MTMQEAPRRSFRAPNPAFVERRLVAILAADVVGFSRMIGEDEVGAVERLRELRAKIVEPLIAEQSGRIFKLMGDGMLAEFPSAVLALRGYRNPRFAEGPERRSRRGAIPRAPDRGAPRRCHRRKQ